MTKKNIVTVLQAFANFSSDGYLLYDLRKREVEYINKSLVDMFDISHESFAHQPDFFINHIVGNDIGLLQSQFELLKKEGKTENIEFSTLAHDGQLRNICVHAYVINEGKYALAVFRDITKVREHENYIIDYGAKKNTLLDMVTHNLSGPLQIAKNLIESLENVVSVNDLKNIHAHIHLIKENTSHCINIVNDFLEEEHMVSSYVSVKRNRFELLTKINAVMERFQKSYPDLEFKIFSNVKELNVSLDDVKFLQVLNNLASNAVKWSTPGQEVQVRIEDEGSHFNVSVIDKGIGIPQHLQRYLFDRNSRAGRPGLQGEKSIGMGLYIVRRLVRMMDGDIMFESHEGKGTTFTLRFLKDDITEHDLNAGARTERER